MMVCCSLLERGLKILDHRIPQAATHSEPDYAIQRNHCHFGMRIRALREHLLLIFLLRKNLHPRHRRRPSGSNQSQQKQIHKHARTNRHEQKRHETTRFFHRRESDSIRSAPQAKSHNSAHDPLAAGNFNHESGRFSSIRFRSGLRAVYKLLADKLPSDRCSVPRSLCRCHGRF